MTAFRNALLVVLGALLWTPPLSGAVLEATGDTDAKPPVEGFVYQRAPFDCTPLQTITLTPGQAGSLVDDTTGGTSAINGYPCAPWPEAGPEHIYRLDVAEGDTIRFWAGLTDIDPLIDHDIFLLEGCDTDSCLVGANTELTAVLTGGSYYLIVDGYSLPKPNQGPYTLAYDCRYPGVSPLVCTPGMATEVDIDLAESVFDDNLFNRFDFVRDFGCSPLALKGGEKWYTLTLPAPVDNQWGQDFREFKVQFNTLAPTLDIALWLFDGCGIEPACLAFANTGTAGQPETLTFRNETDQDLTVYLGVDCFRAPAETGTGFFTIKFTTNVVVPTQKTSFGSVRALYR